MRGLCMYHVRLKRKISEIPTAAALTLKEWSRLSLSSRAGPIIFSFLHETDLLVFSPGNLVFRHLLKEKSSATSLDGFLSLEVEFYLIGQHFTW